MNTAVDRIVVYLVTAVVLAGCAGPALQPRNAVPIEERVRSPDVSAQEAVARTDALDIEASAARGGVAHPRIQIAKAEELDRRPLPQNVAVQSLVAAAMQLAGRGEWDRAQAALERALKLSPNDSSLWTQLAFTHYRRGTLKQAEELAQRALSLASARPGEQAAALRLIADIETAQGKSVQAASARRKAESLAR
ncbi:MAG: tetratricopeptide repeat protein [Pseudomonadota bacterium]|nr:tetratricopeptide repeat protein [Pseudomonadota bacterium]